MHLSYLSKLKRKTEYYYEQEDFRTRFQKRILCGILVVIAFLMTLMNNFTGEFEYALGMFVYFLSVMSCVLMLAYKKYETIGTVILKISSLLMIGFILTFGSDNLSTLLWLAIIPNVAFLLLPFRGTLAFFLALLGAMILFYLTPLNALLGFRFHPIFGYWYSILIFFFFVLISTLLEGLRKMTNAKQETSRKEILRMSYYDDLTQIFNRRSFDRALRELWNSPFVSKLTTSLLMIDIDNFKLYNDNFGHLQGDKILATIAKTINGAIPAENNFTFARYGGEEFVVLMPGTDGRTATELAGIMKNAVSGLGLVYFDSHEASSKILSVSIGVATEDLTRLDHPEALIRIADENLYRAKRNGKNAVWSDTNQALNS